MSELTERVMRELIARYSGAHKRNPAWDRKADKRAWAAGEDYGVPEYIPRPREEAELDTCCTVEFREDGPVIRTVTYREVVEIVAEVEAAMTREAPQ